MALVAEVEAGVPVPEGEAQDAAALLRWMADDEFTFLGYREYDLDVEGDHEVLARPDRYRARPPARRPSPAQLPAARPPPGGRPGQGARAAPARRDEGELALHRPPPRLLRLRRREAHRTRRPGAGGAALPRSMGRRDLPLHHRRDPTDRPQGRGRAPARRPGAGQPRRPRAVERPRDVPARRSVPDQRGRAAGHLARDPQPAGAPSGSPVRRGATTTGASCPASSTCRVERYSTTIVERMEEILLARFGGVSAEYDSSITASVLAAAPCPRVRRASRAHRRRHAARWSGSWRPSPAGGSTTCATRWWRAAARRLGLATFARYVDAFPAAYREAFTSAAAVKDLARLDRSPVTGSRW